MDAHCENILVVGRGNFVTVMLTVLKRYGASHIQVVLLDASSEEVHQLASFLEPWKASANPATTRPQSGSERLTPPFLLNVENLPSTKLIECLHNRKECTSVFYVSRLTKPIPEMTWMETSCKTNRQLLYPAVLLAKRGMAGPFGHTAHIPAPSWMETWRTIHKPELESSEHESSPPDEISAEWILAEVLANEWLSGTQKQQTKQQAEQQLQQLQQLQYFKQSKQQQRPRYYWLNLSTSEGLWYSVNQVHQSEQAEPISGRLTAYLNDQYGSKQHFENIDELSLPEELNSAFTVPVWLERLNERTCQVQGLFHVWEEGSLTQLPLHQCRIQPVDPLSAGPATLLDEQVFCGLTALDARRKAALGGLEAFAQRLFQLDTNDQAVGCGVSREESQYKAIKELLLKQWLYHQVPHSFSGLQPVSDIVLAEKDHEFQYYQEVLSQYDVKLQLFAGEDVYGFPIAAVHIGDERIEKVGFTPTSVWKDALQHSLHALQQNSGLRMEPRAEPSTVRTEQLKKETMPSIQAISARLQRKGNRFSIYQLNVTPYFSEEDGVYFSLAAIEKEEQAK